MSATPAPVPAARIRSLFTAMAGLCWVAQFFSVESVAPQVAPLFQATVAAATAMLALWFWTRLRGIALFAQGASLPVALWGGMLFAVQWGCLYLAVARAPALDVAVDYGAVAYLTLGLLPSARGVHPPGGARPSWRRRLGCLSPALAAAALLAWRGADRGSISASLLTLAAAVSFALDAGLIRQGGMQGEDTLRWRFYQLCVAALLLPMFAVMFSPTWNFAPGSGGLGAIALQALCGGLALPVLRAVAWRRSDDPREAEAGSGRPGLGLLAAPLWIVGLALAAGMAGLASPPDRVQFAAAVALLLAAWCRWQGGRRARVSPSVPAAGPG